MHLLICRLISPRTLTGLSIAIAWIASQCTADARMTNRYGEVVGLVRWMLDRATSGQIQQEESEDQNRAVPEGLGNEVWPAQGALPEQNRLANSKVVISLVEYKNHLDGKTKALSSRQPTGYNLPTRNAEVRA